VSVTVSVLPDSARATETTCYERNRCLFDNTVVLRCHKAKPFAQVVAPFVTLPPTGSPLRYGPGDR
jgi:hypothetical protein